MKRAVIVFLFLFLISGLQFTVAAWAQLAPAPTGATLSSKEWAAQAPAVQGMYAYRHKLRQMVKEKQIEVLQTHFEGQIALYKQGRLSDTAIGNLFDMASSADLADAGVFDTWVQTYPKSFIGPLVRAYFEMELAWQARGIKFSRETLPSEFEEMHRWLPLVRRDVQMALNLEPQCSLCYAMLIRLSMHYSLRKEAKDWFTQGLAADPKSLAVPWTYHYSLEPKWGGSLDQQDALISKLRLVGHSRAVDMLQASTLAEKARNCCGKPRIEGAAQLAAAQASLNVSDNYLAQYSKGTALRDLKRWQESIDVLTALIHNYDADRFAFENRAYAYQQLGRWPEALRDLRIAYDDFRSPWAFEMLVKLSAGNSGWAIRTSPSDAPEICKEAALQDMPIAMTCLGGLHYFGMAGVPKDLSQARLWFQRAADAGDTQGMMDLAQMLVTSQGGPADREKAIQLWTSAAAKGHTQAQSKIDNELSLMERVQYVHWPALLKKISEPRTGPR
jgi:TPR repeat protein